MKPKGKLYLIPSPLGEDSDSILPQSAITEIAHVQYFIVERGKTARRFLKKLPMKFPLQEMTFFELNKRTEEEELVTFIAPLLEGHDVGILSEAGCPGVADPGAQIVELAHQQAINVNPLIGPSSLLLALMGSGMNGQKFAFHGYLPVKSHDKKHQIRQLEQQSSHQNQTQIFIETPYRNNQLFSDFLNFLRPSTKLCVATDLSLNTQFIQTKTIKNWKKVKAPDLHKRPTVFLFLC